MSEADLTNFTQALRGLKPDEGNLDRETLFFRAGQAAVPRNWTWQVASAASSFLALLFGVMLLVRPGPAVVERIVFLPASLPAPEMAPARADEVTPWEDPSLILPPPSYSLPRWPSARGYFHLQEQVSQWGLDALPEPVSTRAEPSSREKLDQFLKSH